VANKLQTRPQRGLLRRSLQRRAGTMAQTNIGAFIYGRRHGRARAANFLKQLHCAGGG
jgi:hypothetical protein